MQIYSIFLGNGQHCYLLRSGPPEHCDPRGPGVRERLLRDAGLRPYQDIPLVTQVLEFTTRCWTSSLPGYPPGYSGIWVYYEMLDFDPTRISPWLLRYLSLLLNAGLWTYQEISLVTQVLEFTTRYRTLNLPGYPSGYSSTRVYYKMPDFDPTKDRRFFD